MVNLTWNAKDGRRIGMISLTLDTYQDFEAKFMVDINCVMAMKKHG